MKKIFIKISSVFAVIMLLINKGSGQLPLQQGDLITTCKNDLLINNAPASLSHPTVMLHKFGNTSTAFMNGKVWRVGDGKPAFYSPVEWNFDALGSVFGISIDDQRQIYVANTSMYGTGAISATKKSSIYQINGSSTSPLAVVIASGMPSSPKYDPHLQGEFGNLKFVRIGGTGYLFITDMGNKKIICLKQASPGSTSWSYHDEFDPKFGTTDNNTKPGQTPYGLSIRTMPGGTLRVYYARMGKGTAWQQTVNTIYGSNKNEIWSIDISSSGNFTGIENKETIKLFGGPIEGFLEENPIADIAFSSYNDKMLCGQQSITDGTNANTTSSPYGSIGAHQSRVYELIEVSPHLWDFSTLAGARFNSGNSTMTSGCSYANGKNAVGGITYSNSILKTNNLTRCDTSVWFTSDLIYYNPCGSAPPGQTLNAVYGFQGMNWSGGDQNSAINIDLDEDYANHDKTRLGDIEAYNLPINCNPCTCLRWDSNPTLNGIPIPGVPINLHPALSLAKAPPKVIDGGVIGPKPTLQNYPLQFVKSNISGLLNAAFLCKGNCGATYTWIITNDATSANIANGTSLPIDLSKYNSILQCGKYTLTIKAKCGTSDCENLVIPITIICEPPSCCKATITTEAGYIKIDGISNVSSSKDYSTGEFDFNFNFSQPISELRMSVEEFRLIASSPNCLNCKNRPVTWGNILSAAINGTTGYVTLPITGVSLPSGNSAADYREAVYNTGIPISPGAERASLILSLPTVTELSCCEVSVYICIKFTFKDIQCRECVQMICGEYKIKPDLKHGPVPDVKTKGNNIDAKLFKISH